MKRNLEKRLLGYAAVASTAAFAGSPAAHGALVTTSFTGSPGNGGGLDDKSNNTFLSMGDDAVTNANGTTDPGVHLYLTNKLDSDSASYVTAGNIGSGTLASLAGGTVVGPSLGTGLNFESDNNAPDNDIAFIDSVTGQQYVPASHAGGAPYQYSVGTPGYFGFSFTPGSTTDYGYASLTYDANGNTAVTYTYDDSGAAVTVPSAAVPEPASLSILALGAVAMLRRSRAL